MPEAHLRPPARGISAAGRGLPNQEIYLIVLWYGLAKAGFKDARSPQDRRGSEQPELDPAGSCAARRRSPVFSVPRMWQTGGMTDSSRQEDGVPPNDRRQVFLAKDTPAEFIPLLEALAAGDFAAAGVIERDEAQRADEPRRRQSKPILARRTTS
jgi:hypothetical protein